MRTINATATNLSKSYTRHTTGAFSNLSKQSLFASSNHVSMFKLRCNIISNSLGTDLHYLLPQFITFHLLTPTYYTAIIPLTNQSIFSPFDICSTRILHSANHVELHMIFYHSYQSFVIELVWILTKLIEIYVYRSNCTLNIDPIPCDKFIEDFLSKQSHMPS